MENLLIKGVSSQINFFKDVKKIVLLIHGFRGNPLNFSELCDNLLSNQYSIYNLRLPGHGLKNTDSILKVKLRDWEIYVENILLDLLDRFEEVNIIGLSIGALLSLNLINKYPSVNKIIFYSPFLEIRSSFIFLLPFIKYFKRKIKKEGIDCLKKDGCFKGVIPFIPIPQVHEIYKLTKKSRKIITLMDKKILCFLSKNDHVLDFKNHKKILSKNFNFKIVELKKSYHNSIVDLEKKYIINETLRWLSAN